METVTLQAMTVEERKATNLELWESLHRSAKRIHEHPLPREARVDLGAMESKGGPKFQKADIEEKDCTEGPFIEMSGLPSTACHSFMGGQVRVIHAQAVNLADVAVYVENWTGGPVVDKTGLEGLYHIETTPWAPMELRSSQPSPGAKQDGLDVADLPTIFDVFQRLGLKMESQKGQVETYVIDHIEKPSEN